MKKLLLPLLFLAFNAFSQDAHFNNAYQVLRSNSLQHEFRGMFNENFHYDFAPQAKRKDLNISKVKATYTYKKGEQRTVEMEFNKKGMPTQSTNLAKKEVFFKAEYQFDTLEVYRYTKYKKHITEVKREYAKGEKVKETKLENGKTIYILDLAYNSAGKVTVSSCLRKGKNHKMMNTYNETGQLSKTEYYIGQKLEKTWIYECKPQGEAIASNKNELISSKCEFREENNNGSYIKFTRTLIKGVPYLLEEKFTKDSLRFETNNYKNDTVLVSKSYTEDQWTYNIHYNKKGKLTSQYKNKFNEDKKVVEYQQIFKNKIHLISKYSYDSKGNNILTENYDGKHLKANSRNISEFNPDGTMISSQHIYKGKMYYGRTYEYSYY